MSTSILDNLFRYEAELATAVKRVNRLLPVYLEGNNPELKETVDAAKRHANEIFSKWKMESDNLAFVAENRMGLICTLCGGYGRFGDFECRRCEGTGRSNEKG